MCPHLPSGPSIPPAQPYCPLHLTSHLLQPLFQVLTSLLSHLLQPGPSHWSFTQTPHQPSYLLLSSNEASNPLSPIPAVCSPTLDHSSSSGPMAPLAESHGGSAPWGGPHLSWDGWTPAKATGIPPCPDPSCCGGLWASLKRLCGQWRSRIQSCLGPSATGVIEWGFPLRAEGVRRPHDTPALC